MFGISVCILQLSAHANRLAGSSTKGELLQVQNLLQERQAR